MTNFCTNCGTKIREEDKFCTNCGTKLKKDETFCFCTNCGTKIREEDKFCTNCGTKIENKNSSKSSHDIIEKEMERIAKENEEDEKKSKMIDEIFESEEIKSEIRKNNISTIHVISIKNNLKNKIIDKKENMSEKEIKYFIKTELKKVSEKQEKARITKEKEMNSNKIEKNKMTHGGYCSLSCIHCYEEFLDSGGEIEGDFVSDGIYEYYCNLGHSVYYGSFCEDYE
jgi:predicted nucleic acid-binding Zn ribbon protein